MVETLAGVWRWRKLVVELARRELRARYAGSALGSAWAVLEPLVQFLLYFTVFSYFLGIRLEGRPGMGSYALYLITGLVPFQIFQECQVRAAGLARAQAGLVRHVSVPLEVLLAAALLAVVSRHMLTLVLVAIAALALGTVAWTGLPLTALGFAILLVGTVGLALALVPAGAFLPDLTHVVGTVGMVLFFLTPIVYSIKAVPAAAARLLVFNPLVGVVEAFRAGLVGGAVSAVRLGYATVVAAALLVAGAWIFTVRGRAVRDVV